MATYTFHIELANTRPNGGMILSRYHVPDTERWIVLAARDEAFNCGFQVSGAHRMCDYATLAVDDDGHAYRGHYYTDIHRASDDYETRCQRGY
jgi:hypothetical protein